MRENKCYCFNISKFSSSDRYIESHKKSDIASSATAHSSFNSGRTELDSHADTNIAGGNCLIMSYTGRLCDVSAYSDEYPPKKGVPIVSAATGYTAADGANYILIVHEALSMPDMTCDLFLVLTRK